MSTPELELVPGGHRRELEQRRPRCSFATRRRVDLSTLKHSPHRARGEAEAELDQLTSDPLIAPARVLPRQPHHQLAQRLVRRWTAGLAGMSTSCAPAPDANAVTSPVSPRAHAGAGVEEADEQAQRSRHDRPAEASDADAGAPTPTAGAAAPPVQRPWRTQSADPERAASEQQRTRGKRRRGASTDTPIASERGNVAPHGYGGSWERRSAVSGTRARA